MYDAFRKVRFDQAALGAMALSVIGLYGVAWHMGSNNASWSQTRSSHTAESTSVPMPTLSSSLPLHSASSPASNITEGISYDDIFRQNRPNATALQTAFAQNNYSLDAVADGVSDVPRLVLAAVPKDMEDVEDVGMRKDLFLRMVLPLVLEVNESIRADRNRLARLQRLAANHRTYPAADRAWMERLAADYHLTLPVTVGRLLRHVDIVPPSLALAQAATESGWGTSRFASQGNALFGQISTVESAGLAPRGQEANKIVHVKKFSSPLKAVEAYVRNLNSHPAYSAFREMRARSRTKGKSLDSASLARTLDSYAEVGTDYTDAIRKIMRSNGLDAFDDARLSQQTVIGSLGNG